TLLLISRVIVPPLLPLDDATPGNCLAEYTTSEKVVGYDVTYEVAGAPTTVRMASKPATKTFPIQDGKVVLPQ
ncbi:hypothetical protein ABJZ09_26815, partial [Vibrio parahaemolyticus]